MRGLKPLRWGGFRLLAAGQVASNLGDAVYAVALPWYVLAVHGGVLLLGFAVAAYGISRALLLAVGGHAGDRWRPWSVMLAADGVRAVACSVLAVAAANGPARVDVLVSIAVILGACDGLFLPSSFAIVPSLVPADEFQAANALLSSGTQLASLAGPALGGALVAGLGPAPAFAIDAGTFALSAISLAGVRRSAAAPTTPSGGDTGDPSMSLLGLLRSERALQVMILVIVAANLGMGGESEVALPALVHDRLHGGVGGYGALIAVLAAGTLIGTLTAGATGRFRRPAVTASAAYLAEAPVLASVPLQGSTVAAGAALAVFGALNGFGNVVMTSTFQEWAPRAIIGRLAALITLASLGVFPISVALAGVAVHAYGPAPFFVFAAATTAGAILVGLSQGAWRDFGARPRIALGERDLTHYD
jgi:MFS family permease